MNDDYSTSFTNSDFNPITETRDFAPDYAPQVPMDTYTPEPTRSNDFSSDYAPEPPSIPSTEND